MPKKLLRGFVVLALFGLAAAGPVRAQSADTEGGWIFQLMPLFWGTGISADITTRVGEQSIDVSFSDILESMHFAAMGTFEGRKGRWGFLFDGGYADIRNSVPQTGALPGDVDIKMVQYGFSLAGTVRIIEGKTALELFAGPRYNYMKNVLEIAAVEFQSTSTDSWVDGFVGARAFVSLGGSWQLLGYADVGAGGSKLTWQAKASVAWRFSKVLSAELGYRHFYFERVADEVSSKMAKSGPYLGLGIWF